MESGTDQQVTFLLDFGLNPKAGRQDSLLESVSAHDYGFEERNHVRVGDGAQGCTGTTSSSSISVDYPGFTDTTVTSSITIPGSYPCCTGTAAPL